MIKIVFMGTPDFSVPTLIKLHTDNEIEIGYVVTKKDAKSNRGQKINFSDVKIKAMEYGLDILQTEKIKEDNEIIDKIKKYNPDFIIVVAYGQILSKKILDIPKVACINGHASLLPKYRGASPIQSAILAGEKITGTTSMLMNEGLDTGDILVKKSIDIEEKETADSLFDKLSVLTADNLHYTIKNFDNINPTKQNDEDATKCVIIKKEYGRIDFSSESAVQIDRKVRAYNSWPSAYFYIDDIEYKVWDVTIISYVISFDNAFKFTDNIYILNNNMYAKCKDGILKINEIQKSGKKRMKSQDFINGLKI